MPLESARRVHDEALTAYYKSFEVQDSEAVKALTSEELGRNASRKIWSGVALWIFCPLAILAISQSGNALLQGFTSLLGIAWLCSKLVIGFGLADEAEARGYSRNLGFLAIGGLFGALIVVLLPKRR